MTEKTKKIKNNIVRRYISVRHEWEAKQISDHLGVSYSIHHPSHVDGIFGRKPPVYWILIPKGKLSSTKSFANLIWGWNKYEIIRVTDDGRFV